MNYKVVRLAGRSYVISSFTPRTAQRVITALRGFNVEELKDIPDAVSVMAEAISIAIAGNHLFSRFKAYFIRKRLMNHASVESLLEAIGVVIEMIPVSEFYAISSITNQFKKAIVK